MGTTSFQLNESLFENLNTIIFTGPYQGSNNFTINFDGWWKVTDEDINFGWDIGYDYTGN